MHIILARPLLFLFCDISYLYNACSHLLGQSLLLWGFLSFHTVSVQLA